MKRKRQAAADFLAAHPLVDQLAPVLVLAVWIIALRGFAPAGESPRLYVYAGVSTLAALVLTAATFVCAFTYQSTSTLMVDVRHRFGTPLRKNWLSILLWSLGCAVLPLVSMAVDAEAKRVSFALTLYALSLLVAKFSRSVFWLKYTLFAQTVSDHLPVVVELAPRSRKPAVDRREAST